MQKKNSFKDSQEKSCSFFKLCIMKLLDNLVWEPKPRLNVLQDYCGVVVLNHCRRPDHFQVLVFQNHLVVIFLCPGIKMQVIRHRRRNRSNAISTFYPGLITILALLCRLSLSRIGAKKLFLQTHNQGLLVSVFLWRILKALSALKSLQGYETETKELLGGYEEKSVSQVVIDLLWGRVNHFFTKKLD